MTKRIAKKSWPKGMSCAELGDKLLLAVGEMKAGKSARTAHVTLNEVTVARQKTGLSQIQFAEALRISPRTLQGWEQGRRQPSGAAQVLIRIANRHPEVIAEALQQWNCSFSGSVCFAMAARDCPCHRSPDKRSERLPCLLSHGAHGKPRASSWRRSTLMFCSSACSVTFVLRDSSNLFAA